MHIVVYLLSGLFILLALGLCFVYYRGRQTGTLLMALAYGVAAAAALAYMHWVPLLAGFTAVWLLRFMGLDPEVPRTPRS